MQRESTEIADFDDENYISLFKTVMAFDEETAPVYTFNSDPKYISQGSGSMKVVTKGNEGADNVAWPGISIQGKDKLHNINLTQYEAIAFDVYNDSDRELRLVFMLNDGFKVFDGIPSFIPSNSTVCLSKLSFKNNNLLIHFNLFILKILHGEEIR